MCTSAYVQALSLVCKEASAESPNLGPAIDALGPEVFSSISSSISSATQAAGQEVCVVYFWTRLFLIVG
jgi:hypothetical protein